MKKIAFLAAAACAALATPAMAQNVTGTITLNGNVGAKCTVTSAPAGATFAQTVNFGELAQANGTLRTGLATDFSTTPVQATVVCNTGMPKVAVDANPMVNAATAPAGYANTINYTASVAVAAVGANAGPFTNATTAAPGAATAVGSALANTTNNVVITTTGYATPGASDILVAGGYTGNIVVVISPN
ncbi:MAG: hypothetical protein ACKOPM_17150 [Novosphingobium sp.]